MTKLPKRTLIYDVANTLFRVAAVQKHKPYARDATEQDLVGLSMHMALTSIYRWYQKFKPEYVVFAFEGGNNWRKAYTAKALSRRQYKANRVVDSSMQHYFKLVDDFKETMRSHTSICCLSVDGFEADDAIAAFCQLYSDQEREILILSGDRDFIQLTKLPGVKLINPDNGKERNGPDDKEYEPNIDYWLFEKCVRGDAGDNVPSAFPGVRSTRIRKAFENQYERVNFMNETWTDENSVTYKVGDLFKENELLIDLEKQPDDLRSVLLETVAEQSQRVNKYSHFQFLRFAQDYQLERIKERASDFVALFAHNQNFLRGALSSQQQRSETTTVPQPPEPAKQNLLEF